MDTEVFVELTLIVSNNVSFKIIGSSILCLHYCCQQKLWFVCEPFPLKCFTKEHCCPGLADSDSRYI